ncbi:MAG: hypothetical protein ACI9ND_001091 [Yoonia sp.]|jgi:hypothetical protein
MKLILYIGHHKVGSTALQVFLSQNSCGLLRAGILYPCVEVQGFSQLLARAIGGGDTPGYLPGNLREPHSALAYKMIQETVGHPVPPQYKMLPAVSQMMHAIKQQIAYLKPHTTILCSEAFANFGEVNPTLIAQLRAEFPEAEIEIYCALRRPDTYLTAWHGQRLKVGEPLAPLRENGGYEYFDTIHTDYRRVVAPWIQNMSNTDIKLRNYADITATGGSPQDLFQTMGLTTPDGLHPVGRPNRSLPLAAIEIIRRGNMIFSPPEMHKFNQHMIQKAHLIAVDPNDDIEVMSPKLRKKLHDYVKPVQDYLNTVSGSEGFFPDLDQVGVSRPIPELEATARYLKEIDPATMPTEASKGFIAALQHEFRLI